MCPDDFAHKSKSGVHNRKILELFFNNLCL
jgi:hypothetical protein